MNENNNNFIKLISNINSCFNKYSKNISINDDFLLFNQKKILFLLDLKNLKIYNNLELDNKISCIHKIDEFILTGHKNGNINVINLKNEKWNILQKLNFHTDMVVNIIKIKHNFLASSSLDLNVIIFDKRNFNFIFKIENNLEINSIFFVNENFVIGMKDQINIFNLKNSKEDKKIKEIKNIKLDKLYNLNKEFFLAIKGNKSVVLFDVLKTSKNLYDLNFEEDIIDVKFKNQRIFLFFKNSVIIYNLENLNTPLLTINDYNEKITKNILIYNNYFLIISEDFSMRIFNIDVDQKKGNFWKCDNINNHFLEKINFWDNIKKTMLEKINWTDKGENEFFELKSLLTQMDGNLDKLILLENDIN